MTRIRRRTAMPTHGLRHPAAKSPMFPIGPEADHGQIQDNSGLPQGLAGRSAIAWRCSSRPAGTDRSLGGDSWAWGG
jgi:hypothetical protein